MSSGGGWEPRHTASCDHVRAALSDYVEDALTPERRQAVETHLSTCPACAAEARQLKSLLALLHERVPRREPVLDIWAELSPKIEELRQEERMPVAARVHRRTSRFLNNFATGAILFTQALAMNTQNRLQKYLINDPYHLSGAEEA
jgi:predicted anti-sigma-YlaC factor YlaD